MNNLKKYGLLFAIIISLLIHIIVINKISFNIFQPNEESSSDIVITIINPKELKSYEKNNLVQDTKEQNETPEIASNNKNKKQKNSIINNQKNSKDSQINKKSNDKLINTSEILSQISEFNLISELGIFNSDKNPRIKSISANSANPDYRYYLEAWEQKVKQIGKRNYPKEASELGMFGSLKLTVIINSKGMISDLYINKPSGHKQLDEAALNIVRLGAPYAKFPPGILKEVDLISITSKLKFTEKNNFSYK